MNSRKNPFNPFSGDTFAGEYTVEPTMSTYDLLTTFRGAARTANFPVVIRVLRVLEQRTIPEAREACKEIGDWLNSGGREP